MKKHVGTTIRFILGIVFLILGVVGSLLPVLQGWMFFLLSALMFFPNHPRTERGLQRLNRRMPRFVGWLRRLGFGKAEEDSLANLDLGELIHPHHDEAAARSGLTPVQDPSEDEPEDKARAAR